MNKVETGKLKANLFFASGVAPPILPSLDARRFFIAQQQLRLLVGQLQLVLATPSTVGRPAMWALPGGGRASTEHLLALARRNGWKRPVQIEVTIRHAPDAVSQETTHGD